MYLRPKAPAAQGKHGLVVVLSLFSLCLGTVFGYWNYSRAGGVGDYWAIGSHEIYEGVSPSEPADARRDAAALAFTKYSRPDARLSTSYAAFGQKYCVAPVMAMGQEYTGTFAAQYFATGKEHDARSAIAMLLSSEETMPRAGQSHDCCRDLEFTCGDALDEAAHSGLVIFNKTQTALSWAFAQDLDYFMKAARMASARFGIHLAEEPIFVSWVSDTKTAMANLWPEARNIWLLSSMLALPAFAVISFACEAFKRAGPELWRNRFSKEKELP
eukprot:g11103.t1